MESKARLVGRLYFRFIASTRLEDAGWTSDTLADFLERIGYIQCMQLEPYNSAYKKSDRPVLQRHFVEIRPLPAKHIVVNLALNSNSRA